MWLDITVAVLSLASMLLTFKYIYEVAYLYSVVQKQNTTIYKTAYDLQREAYAKIVEKNRSFHQEQKDNATSRGGSQESSEDNVLG